MDEIELKQTYNECVTLINTDNPLNFKRALNLMLQMIWQLHENIQEMQVEEDDDE